MESHQGFQTEFLAMQTEFFSIAHNHEDCSQISV
jgi:hypothetical protein